MLPESVLRTAQAEMLEYGSSGQSVMEMSHRSSVYDAIIKETEAALRRVLCIPDNYKVGFIQGGASTQFAMVPMNLMTTGEADYLVTGQFSGKAAKEAEKFGRVNVPASSKDKNFTYIPDVDAVEYSKNASYIHICENNTIYGTRFTKLPHEVGGLANMEARNNAKAKLLYDYLDGSSFFSNPVNKPDRSIMNVTFTSPSPELDKKFCAEAAAAGFVNLKGHRSVGGMRASIYNAMPAEGVEKLVEFMKQFEADNA